MTLVSNSGSGLTPANGAARVANHVANLASAGWTVPRWSDGTTLHTSGLPTAADLAHTSAHVEAVRPDGLFAYSWQRGTTNVLWREKEAPGAFATGATATQVGTNAAEAIRLGAGTDASPTYATAIGADGSYHQHCVADDAAPYFAYTICPTNSTGAESSGGTWIHEPVLNSPSTDTRPWVQITSLTTASILATGSSKINDDTAASAKAWLGFFTTPAIQNVGACTYALNGGAVAPNGVGTNSNNNRDDGVSIVWARRGSLSAPSGEKGVSANLKWQGLVRSDISTLSHLVLGVETIFRITYSQISLPFPNVTPSV
jgi:hypothetical protein